MRLIAAHKETANTFFPTILHARKVTIAAHDEETS